MLRDHFPSGLAGRRIGWQLKVVAKPWKANFLRFMEISDIFEDRTG
jgi:hypothetical protein